MIHLYYYNNFNFMEKERSAQEVQVNAADGSIVDSIESKIFNIRGKQVMLDRDLAVLYGNAPIIFTLDYHSILQVAELRSL